MLRYFNKFKISFIVSAVITFLFGLVLIIFPQQTSSVMCYIFGGLLLLLGIVLIVKFFSVRSTSSLFSVTLVAGLILSAIGIFLLAYQNIVISMIPFVFGIFIAVDGLINIQRSIILCKHSFKAWYFALALSILSVVLGIVLIFNPFDAAIVMIRFIGISFVFNGLLDLWSTISFSKNVKFVLPDDFVIGENNDK